MDVLFDHSVNFIDEIEEIIQERGDSQTRDQTIASSLHNHGALDDHERRAVRAGQARQEAEAILRERKAASSSSSAWRKEPVTFSGADAAFCRKVLNGVDPVLPEQLAAAPAVNSLTLRFSWPPWHCAARGSIASAHDGLLALCVGGYREHGWQRWPGCYLVLDARARSVAVAPQLPWFADILSQHCFIGSTRVAVLRSDGGGGFLLAELFRQTDQDERGMKIPANKATLFMWCSPGSGQWVRKEVVLPFPASPGEDDDYIFSFNAGTVFAVSSTSFCWVDVWRGILICNNISRTDDDDDDDDGNGGGDAGDGLEFRYIPLPEACARSSPYHTTEHRAVCCVDSETIKLLIMDDGGEEVTAAVTAWTLRLRSPLAESGWRWEKDEDASCSSLCVADLLDDAIPYDDGDGGKHSRRLLRRVARCPVVGVARPGVVHVTVLELEYRRKKGEWESTGSYGVSLDVPRRSVASVCAFSGSVDTHGALLCTLE